MALDKRVALIASQAITIGGTQDCAAMTSTLVATRDITTDLLNTYARDEGTHQLTLTGTGLFELNMGDPTVCAMSSNRVASIETKDDRLRMYEWGGASWSQIGNDFTIGITAPGVLLSLSATRVVHINGNADTIRTIDFDGTNWSYTGNALNVAGMSTSPTGCVLSSSRIVVADNSLGGAGGSIRVLDFDGTDWTVVGNVWQDESVPQNPLIVSVDATHFLALLRSSPTRWVVFEFDGTDISITGAQALGELNLGLTELPGGELFLGTAVNVAQTYQTVDIGDINPVKTTNILVTGNVFFNTSLTKMSDTRVAMVGGSFFANQSFLCMYETDGSDWTLVGNKLSILPDVGYAAFCASLDATTVALIDNFSDTIRTFTFDGTDWSQVGSALSVDTVSGSGIVHLGDNTVVVTAINSQIGAYHFDGSSWAQVGNFLNIGGSLTSIAKLTSTKVAVHNANVGELQTYSWDGSNFSEVGDGTDLSSIISPAFSGTAMDALSETQLVIGAVAGDQIVTMDYVDGAWERTGFKYYVYQGQGGGSPAVLDGTVVALASQNGTGLHTVDFAGIVVGPVVIPGFWEALGPNAVQGAS